MHECELKRHISFLFYFMILLLLLLYSCVDFLFLTFFYFIFLPSPLRSHIGFWPYVMKLR